MSRWLPVVASLAVAACGFQVDPLDGGSGDDSGPSGCTTPKWRDPAWASRYPLVVQHARVTGTPGTLPVLVAFTAGDLVRAQPGGEDLLFTAADGVSILPFEIEQFDRATGALLAWVRLPVSSGEDTTFYLYFANANPAPPQAADVWPDYLAVWHFREDPGSVAAQARDSSLHANHATAQNMASSDKVAAKIGSGFMFDGVNNGLTVPSFAHPSQFAIEAWVRPASVSGYRTVVDLMTNNRWFGLYFGGIDYYDGFDHPQLLTVALDAWHYMVATSNGTQVRIYFDGAMIGNPIAVTVPPVTSRLQVGFSIQPNEFFWGTVDELRIHAGERSASEIITNLASQGSPGSFVKPGALESCR
jgi:hypothetical protein